MFSKETIELFKKSLKPGHEVWVYTRGGTGGGNGEIVELTDEVLVLEGVYRGRKFCHYFILNNIESIKVYLEAEKT
ncbi:MAG TPA: hypothetical protein PL110_21635 [Candidatus Eremiobacteraeota bacterium]|nr:MAG: hypothetical protein BWY64_01651 [bacterium ADurb.Bin363]HPZ10707.1 hypothetical protein [Candidatus Eremiobacteraeota bacterium]